ncbi:MAG: type IV pilus twitching motility protein PilT [Capsulimonadaceae bacterium]
MLTLNDLLTATVDYDGSDLHIKVGSPPLVRIRGDLIPLNVPPLTPELSRDLSFAALSQQQIDRFNVDRELDFAYAIEGKARFRGNCFLQRGNIQAVFRVIPLVIRSMEELNLPPVCKYFSERPRGLVLVTGPAGSGKSTTQAAMIDYINRRFPVHIVTIEDPIEFVHTCSKALINQRELDRDTRSFSNALRAVLRQDPDVILVGEMRDLDTMSLAVTAAETGHLVFGTLHTTDAVQTIDRVIDVFPQHQQQQIRMQISVNLVGVVSQALVKTVDGTRRVAAFETLVGVSSVRSMIREAKTHQIGSLIQTGMKQGMVTMDQSLANLVLSGQVTYEAASEKSHNIAEFRALCNIDKPPVQDIADESGAPPPPPPPGDSQTVKPSKPAGPLSGRMPFGFKRS